MLEDSIDGIVEAVEREDAMTLRELSGDFSRLAVTEQSEDNINLALVTYCLNKIYSKVHFKKNWGALKKNVLAKLAASDFRGVLDEIEEFDRKYGAFEGNLVGKARIKVSSRLYSNGLSLSQAANLTSVRISDILSYVGATKTHENVKPASVSERLDVARKVLKSV